MSRPDPNQADSIGADPRDTRIGELINDYFDRRQKGEDLSEEQFLGEHPEFADELREHFVGLDLIGDLGNPGSSQRTLPGGKPPAFKGSSAATALDKNEPYLPEIPGYQVLKQIGRGGMGLVYKAVQISTKRVVALKVLAEGPFASDVARNRFEREIALAAQLKHFNIIPIYDSGAFDGRMFYAMEHVYGLPLNDHIRNNAIAIPAILKIFAKVCDAVSHAHQRGVVHRDLKPSNILVDGNSEPHVLDFGLARSGSVADANTSMTAQIIGTPAYMSPEQAAGDPSGIDTRTDVYSLGVILYELLTGQMPYETSGGMAVVLRNIAQAEPPPPNRIRREIDDDLAAIVLKALEKGRDERYQSASSLQEDILRFLEGEPVSAKPASGIYLLKKAAWKHRGALAAMLVLGMAVAVAGMLVKGSMENARQVKEKTRQVEDLTKQIEAKKEKSEAIEGERDAAVQRVDQMLSFFLPNLSASERARVVNIFIAAGGRKDQFVILLGALVQAISGSSEEEPGRPARLTKPSIMASGDEFLDDPTGAGSAPSEWDAPNRLAEFFDRAAEMGFIPNVTASQPAVAPKPLFSEKPPDDE